MTTTEYILTEKGIDMLETIRTPLNVSPACLNVLMDETEFKIRNAVLLDDGQIVSLSVKKNSHLWSVPLDDINLRCTFKIIKRNTIDLLVPSYQNTTEADPEMTHVWIAPDGMRLRLAVNVIRDDGWFANKMWLFAFDAAGATYQLPVPNLHDDCSVCSGDFERRKDTSMECLYAAMAQFEKSAWNADLVTEEKIQNSSFLFAYDPKTMEQIPYAGDWTKMCYKRSVKISESIQL